MLTPSLALSFQQAGQFCLSFLWTSSDPFSHLLLTRLCFFRLKCHPACLPTIQILTHKVQPKASAWKTFLKSPHHNSSPFFSEFTALTVCCTTELVLNQRQILWDSIWRPSPCLAITFKFMDVLSPKVSTATVNTTLRLSHLLIFTEFVGKHFQILNKFWVVDQTYAVCYQ